jgi:hypothetical protein
LCNPERSEGTYCHHGFLIGKLAGIYPVWIEKLFLDHSGARRICCHRVPSLNAQGKEK